MNTAILTLVTFIPTAGAIVLMLMPRNDKNIRWTALLISILAFAFSLYLPFSYHSGQPGFQFEVNHAWI